MGNLYDTDFVAWAYAQAALLRGEDLPTIDALNIAEEIEGVARSERRELGSRLAVLLAHLLKWKFQPDYRTHSWLSTIRGQRDAIAGVLDDSPSLRRFFDDEKRMKRVWSEAVAEAERQTHLCFPDANIWNADQILDPDFFPD